MVNGAVPFHEIANGPVYLVPVCADAPSAEIVGMLPSRVYAMVSAPGQLMVTSVPGVTVPPRGLKVGAGSSPVTVTVTT
jgi:hypothetical protein